MAQTGPDAPYNPKEAAQQLARERRNTTGRKLSFYNQCAAFYALYNGARSHVVAKAFDISQTAASQIGGCLARDPRPIAVEWKRDKQTGAIYLHETPRDMNRNRSPVRTIRYRRVAEEFERLGEEEFAARYFPREIAIRLIEVQRDIDAAFAKRARQGPDPTPDGKPDYVDLPDSQPRIRIGWLETPRPPGPAGWYIIGEHFDNGAYWESDGEQCPFQNEAKARTAVWLSNGYTLEDIPQ